MLRFMTLILAASTFGHAVSANDFNNFVDKTIASNLPPLIRNASSLYPEARIPSHRFELLGKFAWQNMEVRLTEGAVKGLDVVPERSGSCTEPMEFMSGMISVCALDLSKLQVTYTAQTSRGGRKRFWVDVRITSAKALITLVTHGSRPYAILATLRANLLLHPIELQTSYDSDLDLESPHQIKFVREVERYTRSELTKIIKGSYLRVLKNTFANTCFICKRSS
uniref:Putative secreted protein n=2 Tax=Ixodes ricinus TaxID=34613 RepID=V5GYQ1_IXORI